MNAPQQFPLARQSAGVAPLRRPHSIRRTTSIDSWWPDGPNQAWTMEGRGRDILTGDVQATPEILGEARYRLQISQSREIIAIETDPPDRRAEQLIGIRAGGDSRRAISAVFRDEIGRPLYQILDDFAGASLVARWVWSQWMDDFSAFAGQPDQKKSHGRNGNMTDICTGFAEGSSALGDGRLQDPNFHSKTVVGLPQHPDDPAGWHEMRDSDGPSMRRSRRIDLWRDGDMISVDAAFQDSGSAPDGGRVAVHEYRVYAEIAAQTGILLSLQALPLILPFRECPGASAKAARMVGQPVGGFRNAVLETLPSTLGCTHLNDVLRALADVPDLATRLA